MKKARFYIAAALIVALILSCAVTVSFAESSNVKVTVDGKSVTFNNDLGYPYIDNNGRTMVPFRAVANFMTGVNVDWYNEAREAIFAKTGTIVLSSGESYTVFVMVHFPIGSVNEWVYFYSVNDNTNAVTNSYHRLVGMDTASVIKNSRTYAPIRYLAEALGYTVGWDDKTRTVIINKPSGNWATAVVTKESNYGTTRVDSQSKGQTYAGEFMRWYYPGVNYGLTVKGRENIGSTYGYLYSITSPEYKGKLYLMVSDKGEFWYSTDDGLNYSRMELD